MEFPMLIIGFTAAVLIFPPRLSGAIQRTTLRKLSQLSKNTKHRNQGER